jgi:acetyl esterase
MSATSRMSVRLRLLTGLITPLLSVGLKPPNVQLSSRPIGKPDIIWVPTRHGEVRCFVYWPNLDAPLARRRARPPVHINLHGGGFLLTNPRQDEHVVSHIAGEVGAVVVNVDYSTAPAVAYPIAEEQCFDVFDWVSNPINDDSWDTRRVGVGGGSAGGKLALNVAQLAHTAGRDNLRALALTVPYLDATVPPAEYLSPLSRPVIGPRTADLIQRTYFFEESLRGEPLASPGLDPALRLALPPTIILSAADDTLLTQVERLVARLEHEGQPVSYIRFENVDHDFITSKSTPDSIIREAVEAVGRHLVTHLAVDDAYRFT